jgi:uncharacterized membrane protein
MISALTFHEALNVSLGLGVVLIGAGVLLTSTSGRSPEGDRSGAE